MADYVFKGSSSSFKVGKNYTFPSTVTVVLTNGTVINNVQLLSGGSNVSSEQIYLDGSGQNITRNYGISLVKIVEYSATLQFKVICSGLNAFDTEFNYVQFFNSAAIWNSKNTSKTVFFTFIKNKNYGLNDGYKTDPITYNNKTPASQLKKYFVSNDNVTEDIKFYDSTITDTYYVGKIKDSEFKIKSGNNIINIYCDYVRTVEPVEQVTINIEIQNSFVSYFTGCKFYIDDTYYSEFTSGNRQIILAVTDKKLNLKYSIKDNYKGHIESIYIYDDNNSKKLTYNVDNDTYDYSAAITFSRYIKINKVTLKTYIAQFYFDYKVLKSLKITKDNWNTEIEIIGNKDSNTNSNLTYLTNSLVQYEVPALTTIKWKAEPIDDYTIIQDESGEVLMTESKDIFDVKCSKDVVYYTFSWTIDEGVKEIQINSSSNSYTSNGSLQFAEGTTVKYVAVLKDNYAVRTDSDGSYSNGRIQGIVTMTSNQSVNITTDYYEPKQTYKFSWVINDGIKSISVDGYKYTTDDYIDVDEGDSVTYEIELENGWSLTNKSGTIDITNDFELNITPQPQLTVTVYNYETNKNIYSGIDLYYVSVNSIYKTYTFVNKSSLTFIITNPQQYKIKSKVSNNNFYLNNSELYDFEILPKITEPTKIEYYLSAQAKLSWEITYSSLSLKTNNSYGVSYSKSGEKILEIGDTYKYGWYKSTNDLYSLDESEPTADNMKEKTIYLNTHLAASFIQNIGVSFQTDSKYINSIIVENVTTGENLVTMTEPDLSKAFFLPSNTELKIDITLWDDYIFIDECDSQKLLNFPLTKTTVFDYYYFENNIAEATVIPISVTNNNTGVLTNHLTGFKLSYTYNSITNTKNIINRIPTSPSSLIEITVPKIDTNFRLSVIKNPSTTAKISPTSITFNPTIPKGYSFTIS